MIRFPIPFPWGDAIALVHKSRCAGKREGVDGIWAVVEESDAAVIPR